MCDRVDLYDAKEFVLKGICRVQYERGQWNEGWACRILEWPPKYNSRAKSKVMYDSEFSGRVSTMASVSLINNQSDMFPNETDMTDIGLRTQTMGESDV